MHPRLSRRVPQRRVRLAPQDEENFSSISPHADAKSGGKLSPNGTSGIKEGRQPALTRERLVAVGMPHMIRGFRDDDLKAIPLLR